MGESTETETAIKATVLIVDDSKMIRLLLHTYLKNDFEVLEAADGREALRCLDQSDIDVIVTDLQMPDLDGFGLIEAVRARGLSTEVILVTCSDQQDVAIRALRLGAHDFLTKPLAAQESVVLTVSRALEKKRLKDTNARLLRELEALSRTDGLTGVGNRRVFDETLAQELARAQRYGVPVSLAMIDIDHFKHVNDAHGHPAGDAVLRAVAERLTAGVRETDRVFRYGGEEFAILLIHAPIAAAADVCGRLLQGLRETPIDAGTTCLRVTASVGVACTSGESMTAADLIARADRALYQAKACGRDRVVAADSVLASRSRDVLRKIS
jgi:two-component system, cell cycle response regulator